MYLPQLLPLYAASVRSVAAFCAPGAAPLIFYDAFNALAAVVYQTAASSCATVAIVIAAAASY